MFAHGIFVVGLFYVADIIENRTNTRQIEMLGGIRQHAVIFTIMFFIVLLASIALPLTNSFIGEFLLLLGIYEYNLWYAIISGLGMITGAIYMLYNYQKIMLGESNKFTNNFADLSVTERAVFIPIVVLIFVLGIHPQFLINLTESNVIEIINKIIF